MSESFEKLRNRILSDARVKSDGIIRDAEEKARQTVDASKAAAEKESANIIAKTRLDAEALRRSILSSKVRANRLRLLDEKNRLLRSVLSTVEERLSSISKTPEFKDTVKKMLNEAVEAVGTDQPIVRIGFNQASSRDLGSVNLGLPPRAKVEVENEAIDELGGVVASDPQGKMTFNNSFRARIDRLDSQLLSLISSTIFGE